MEDCVFLSFVCFNVNAASIYTSPLIIDKAHFQAREETTLESLKMTEKGEQDAELDANTPTRIRRLLHEWRHVGFRVRQHPLKGLLEHQGPHLMNGWVRKGPAPLHGWKLRTRRRDDWPEASLKDLRRSGEPEAPILSGWCSNHGLPPPLRWRSGSRPHPDSHPPREATASPQVPRAGSRDWGLEALRRFCGRRRSGSVSLQSNMAAAATPAQPPSGPEASLGALRWRREDGPATGPSRRCRCSLEEVTYPTWLTAAAQPPTARREQGKPEPGGTAAGCTEGGAARWARLRSPRQPIRGRVGGYDSAATRGWLCAGPPSNSEDFEIPFLISPSVDGTIIEEEIEEKEVPTPRSGRGGSAAGLPGPSLITVHQFLTWLDLIEIRGWKWKRRGLINIGYMVRKGLSFYQISNGMP